MRANPIAFAGGHLAKHKYEDFLEPGLAEPEPTRGHEPIQDA